MYQYNIKFITQKEFKEFKEFNDLIKNMITKCNKYEDNIKRLTDKVAELDNKIVEQLNTD